MEKKRRDDDLHPRRIECTFFFVSSVLLLLAACSVQTTAQTASLQGELLLLRHTGNDVMTVHYPYPQSSAPFQTTQTLSGNWTSFSLSCKSCTGPAWLFVGKLRRYAMLTDKALLTITSDGKVSQVMPLDLKCIPRYLQETFDFPFTVVCDKLAFQPVLLNDNSSLVLLDVQNPCGKRDRGVLVEGTYNGIKDLFAIFYSGGFIQRCSIGSGFIETPILPENVQCDVDAELYPVQGKEEYLLRCNTSEGPAVYVMPVFTEINSARRISVDGEPFSSPTGKYLVVVSGPLMQVLVTDNSNVPSKPCRFSGKILSVEFLNSHLCVVLTKEGGHTLLDLEKFLGFLNSSVAMTQFVSGKPLAWQWVDNEKLYIFVTEDKGICTTHLYNTSSGKELVPVKDIAEKPDLVLFREMLVPTEPAYKNTDGGLSEAVIAGSIVGTFVLILIVLCIVVAVAALLWYRALKRRRKSDSDLDMQPLFGDDSRCPMQERAEESSSDSSTSTSGSVSCSIFHPSQQEVTKHDAGTQEMVPGQPA